MGIRPNWLKINIWLIDTYLLKLLFLFIFLLIDRCDKFTTVESTFKFFGCSIFTCVVGLISSAARPN